MAKSKEVLEKGRIWAGAKATGAKTNIKQTSADLKDKATTSEAGSWIDENTARARMTGASYAGLAGNMWEGANEMSGNILNSSMKGAGIGAASGAVVGGAGGAYSDNGTLVGGAVKGAFGGAFLGAAGGAGYRGYSNYKVGMYSNPAVKAQ